MTARHALIVDDDSANRAIWELVLTDRGYQVSSAIDLQAGLDQVSDSITLYLIDYHLPDGRGTDIVSHVKANFPASLIVMVSMDDDADVIREAMRAGGNLFMVKPASPTIMNEILDEIENGQLNVSARQLINRHGRRTYAA
jgi:DNA-binding NtrC family response regulator